MSSRHNPQLGVIVDTPLQRHTVCQAIQTAGYNIAVILSPESTDDKALKSKRIDLWWIEISDEDKWADFIVRAHEMALCPILMGDGYSPKENCPGFITWERKIYSKIKRIVGQPVVKEKSVNVEALERKIESTKQLMLPVELEAQGSSSNAAENIWVIGASLGGPGAVTDFLSALPPGLPMAFIVAQHIDAGFQATLMQVWGRHKAFKFVEPTDGRVLSHGQAVIAPVEHVITITKDSKVKVHNAKWSMPYAPSVDQVMNNMIDGLGKRTGAILFSGMGNDGAIAALRMKNAGVQVWAQSADSCVCSSMPDSARSIDAVSFTGSPRQLAFKLVDYARTYFSIPKAKQLN